MIIVTGATGALNGATVDHLLDRVPAGQIAVAVRDVAKAQRFADRGVQVRQADYAHPASLPSAFDGADQLLLVSSNDPGADAVSLHRNAIDAAVAAGVGRILYTSHQGAAPDSPFSPARGHAATEQLLAASGTAWTSLRNGFYAHSLDWLAGPWRETGRISVPALVVVGQNDPLYGIEIAQMMQSKIKGAQLQVVPGAAHAAIFEAPQDAGGAIASWAGKLPSSSR